MAWVKTGEEPDRIEFSATENKMVLFKPLYTRKYHWEEDVWRIAVDNRLHPKSFKTKEEALAFMQRNLLR